MDSYNTTLAHAPRACKPFKMRTYEKRVCKPFGIRTCKIIGLKTAWNQHLQKYGGFPLSTDFVRRPRKPPAGRGRYGAFP